MEVLVRIKLPGGLALQQGSSSLGIGASGGT